MRHDPSVLEAKYGTLRRRLEAMGVRSSLWRELPLEGDDDALLIEPRSGEAGLAVALGAQLFDGRWFLTMPGVQAEKASFEVVGRDVAEAAFSLAELPRARGGPVTGGEAEAAVPGLVRLGPHERGEVQRRERARVLEGRGWRAMSDPAEARDWLERFDDAHSPRGSNYRMPEPCRVWSTERYAAQPREVREQLEAALTLASLRALRAAVRPGDRVLVLDWISTSYELDPHAGIADAYLESWARRWLDDESIYWVDPGDRFGIITDWRSLRFRAFGEALVGALEADLPAVLEPLPPGAPSDEGLDALLRAMDGDEG